LRAVDRFIVGTGRCGSTLLSRMLAEHPGALSISELFNGIDMSLRFSPEAIDGERYAALIAAEQPFVTAVLRRGYEAAEIVYPFDRGRHRRDAPLPWILVSMLPRLGDDPDALFD
jgi:putative sulfotransferase